MKFLFTLLLFYLTNIILVRGLRMLTFPFTTRSGLIYGSIEDTKYGRQYYAFRGIPYAKPPVGELRFKAPQPPDKWLGVRDATKDGPFCIQKNYLFANPVAEGQEDCLYLNVYIPIRNTRKCQSKLLPVLVFIHWGGFFAGRGTSDYLGPEYFMEKDVILVTFNYRLGIFGFLTTLDDEAPGNYALKDQVAALKWVQENIHYFGGDKSKVTIFGQSAGAASVHYHMLSPLSKGLFRAAISQSGSALALWATPSNLLQNTVLAAQAKFVNCDRFIGNNSQLIHCLRTVPANALIESQDLFKTFYVDPLTVYTVVTETLTEANPKPFITKLPIEYIQKNEFHNVPWIIGVVQDEGLLKAEGFLRQTEVRSKLNSQFDSILTELMYFSLSVAEPQDLYRNVTEFYLQNRSFVDVSDANSVQGFVNLYGDRAFIYSSYQSALLHAIKGHSPIWFYNFDYKGFYSYGNLFAGTIQDIDFEWGVSHCDDLLYLFNSPGLIPPLMDEIDIKLSEFMVTLWTNFAIYGEPNPPGYFLFRNSDWLPLDVKSDDENKNEKFCFLNFTGGYNDHFDAFLQCGFHKERMSFWGKQHLLENIEGLS